MNIANRSGSGGRSKSLSSRGFGGDKHKLSNPTPTPPTILKPSDSRSSRKGSSKLSAPSSKGNNEDTSATSGYYLKLKKIVWFKEKLSLA